MKEYRYVIKLGSEILHKIKYPEKEKTRCGQNIEIYDTQYRTKQNILCKKCFRDKE